MNTNKDGIPENVGYPKGMQGTVNRAVTRTHVPTDEGKTFTDNFGRSYVYTNNGLIFNH